MNKPHVKRMYDPPSPKDGARILVDRIWPRGVSKDAAELTDVLDGGNRILRFPLGGL